MFIAPLTIALLSTVVGAFLPAIKGILQELLKRPKGREYLDSSFGRALLKGFDVQASTDTPKVLFSELEDASKAMDKVVARIREFTSARELAVTKLESQLGSLTEEEATLRERIKNLQNVPLPAVNYFKSLMNEGEKSSALRDYILFFAGVVVSAIIGIVLKHFGLA